ncbi:hypothetical protein MPSEU_001082500 [Mayamaea pseudoterrestris]|nr:hypothetical protein MPSEU_001082500 [Mayamaea pseudoterrestris]
MTKTANQVVDLTHWFTLPHSKINSRSNNSHDTWQETASEELCQQLLQNLYATGWSLVCIDSSRLCRRDSACDDDSHDNNDDDSVLLHPFDWTSMMREMFKEEIIQQPASDMSLTFRSFESGASGTATVEPKLSWEMTMANAAALCDANISSSSKTSLVQRRMKTWTKLLHAVAASVRRALQLPGGLLLDEEDDGDYKPSSCTDLLRAFYYHPVASDSDGSNNTATFGSSPHTDWGSFTVVYQDETIGGLQTYCRRCGEWINVPTIAELNHAARPSDAAAASTFVRFVVHIGDITSLAIHQALLLENAATNALATSLAADRNDTTTPFACFPSPLHRVVSPTTEARVSLVYFAYPPSYRSIREVAERLALANWIANVSQHVPLQKSQPVSYQDYYLLQNQSAEASMDATNCDEDNAAAVSATAEFERIVDLPVGSILQDKWRQVQRIS